MRVFRFTFLAVAVVTAASAARAQTPALDDDLAPTPIAAPTLSPDTSEPAVRGYGWQTLIADGASIAALAIGSAGGDPKYHRTFLGDASGILVGLGAVGYGFGGPAVHAGNGHWDKAGESLGVRLSAPIAGALTGYGIGVVACDPSSRNDEIPCPAVTAGVGFVTGAIAAIALDAGFIARETVARPTHSLRLAPVVSFAPGRATFGAVGSF